MLFWCQVPPLPNPHWFYSAQFEATIELCFEASSLSINLLSRDDKIDSVMEKD